MSNQSPVYRSPQGAEELWQGPVERLAWGGLGMARAQDGRLILLSAPLALLPGEEVEARVRWKARHGEGEVERWTAPDPRRTDPGCPVALACGGCGLLGAGELQEGLKREMVEDLLRRQLPGAPPFRWLPAPAGARRHRIQLHWNGRALGFHRRQSHEIVPVDACPAALDRLSAAIPRLRAALEDGPLPRFAQRWELSTGTPPEAVLASSPRGGCWTLGPEGFSEGAEPPLHRHRGLALRHEPGGFFQVCAPWAMSAFASILEDWGVQGRTLFDLYGGVGLFSALLGERFSSRVLVEFDPKATLWARRNLEALGLETECIAADVERWVPASLGRPADMILLDPPRSGLGQALCARLQGAQAGSLVLVGCDGAAFCRDAKDLAPAWQLHNLAVVDLFPHTPHVECVGLFHRKA